MQQFTPRAIRPGRAVGLVRFLAILSLIPLLLVECDKGSPTEPPLYPTPQATAVPTLAGAWTGSHVNHVGFYRPDQRESHSVWVFGDHFLHEHLRRERSWNHLQGDADR